MTLAGYNRLRQEVIRLKGMRVGLANAIEKARELGDLRENAEYEAAKNASGLNEAKIRDYETKLASAEIIDPNKLTDFTRVVFGVSVKIEDLDSGEARTVTIVGSDEADVDKGRISFESPMAKSLIGKTTGDVAKVQAPAGVREYEIGEIFVDITLHEEEA